MVKKSGGGSSDVVKDKTGLIFRAGVVGARLKRGRFAKWVSKHAAVFLAASLEYATSELLDLAAKVAAKKKTKTLRPRHIALAVRSDDELSKLLSKVSIAGGGVTPHVHAAVAKRK
eukprot:TRINITY_DN8445_c0_g1_i1.p3 TRINITY_DN8445_c0_g1~~TRINITY_DN8445_c0_g1_i1.p3  ORF type:complete len:116 (+),score=58.05 TRINITY_DN8445_c0_g1_i1:74-421(+)